MSGPTRNPDYMPLNAEWGMRTAQSYLLLVVVLVLEFGCGQGIWCDPPVTDEICAGRLAEAVAKILKGTERLGSAPADQEGRRLAGAPEPEQIET